MTLHRKHLPIALHTTPILKRLVRLGGVQFVSERIIRVRSSVLSVDHKRSVSTFSTQNVMLLRSPWGQSHSLTWYVQRCVVTGHDGQTRVLWRARHIQHGVTDWHSCLWRLLYALRVVSDVLVYQALMKYIQRVRRRAPP